MDYQRRILDRRLDELLPDLAAIAIVGAKGVGKTATASRRARTVLTLTDPEVRLSAEANHDLVMQVTPPVLIDEWQLVPPTWDRVRRAVDDGAEGGRFLLTGSADPRPGIRVHSGAGRIVRFTMRPLSFSERAVAQPTVSLRAILAGERPEISGASEVGVDGYVDEILRSGFPGIRKLREPARDVQLDSYLTTALDRELVENGIEVRRAGTLRRWLQAYAAATATDAAYSTILDAATPAEGDKPSRAAVDSYREHLTRLFLLDPIDAWIPSFAPLARLTKAPKHHLVDPALAARLVGVGRAGLLVGGGQRVSAATGTWLGALFESLVAQSVRIYAEGIGARVGHLRTQSTRHEVDLIVERPDRSIVAIEVKLAASVGDADVTHLNWLHSQIGERLIDRIVVNTGGFAYRRPDGVAVIPLALLGE